MPLGLQLTVSRSERVADGSKHPRRANQSRSTRDRLHADPATATSSRAAISRPLPDDLGSGAAAQHGPSRLRAVGGAASATSAAASSSPRKRAPRPVVGVALGQDAECRPLRSQAPRCPMVQKRLKDTLGLTPERVSGVPLRGLEMSLAQAGSAPMARPQESRCSAGSTR